MERDRLLQKPQQLFNSKPRFVENVAQGTRAKNTVIGNTDTSEWLGSPENHVAAPLPSKFETGLF